MCFLSAGTGCARGLGPSPTCVPCRGQPSSLPREGPLKASTQLLARWAAHSFLAAPRGWPIFTSNHIAYLQKNPPGRLENIVFVLSYTTEICYQGKIDWLRSVRQWRNSGADRNHFTAFRSYWVVTRHTSSGNNTRSVDAPVDPPAGSHLSEAVQTLIRSSSFRVGSLHDLFQTSRQIQGAS